MLSDVPVVTVHIPSVLRPYVGGHDELTASGETVGEVLEAIGHEYPAFASHWRLDVGHLQPGLAIYLGPKDIGQMQGLATPIDLEELVSIVANSVPETSLAAEMG